MGAALAAWSAKQRKPQAPFVCSTVPRGDDTIDVVIEFHPHTGQRFEVTDIWIDGYGDLLTDAEIDTLTNWLEHGNGHDTACIAAEGHAIDQEMARGCDAYHRQREQGGF